MSNTKEEVRKKWLFMNKEEMIPGLIVDNMTYEQMIGWMDTTPYEDARKRMNSEEVESLIIEFVEMMWSITPDYYDLKAILDTEFYIKNEDCGMLVECTVNTNIVKLLKKISMLLSQPNRHIQILTLYVDQQPDPSILKQKLDDLSEEFDMTYAKDSICIEWTNKKVIVRMQN